MVFSKEVASSDLVKLETLKGAEPPRNAKELKSFLCTVQYNAPFIESYAPQIDILRDLMKTDGFTWKREQMVVFDSLKEALAS